MQSAHALRHVTATGAPPKNYHLLLFAIPAIRIGAFVEPDTGLNVIKCIELGKEIADSLVIPPNALCQY
jgi:hypothetical protein